MGFSCCICVETGLGVGGHLPLEETYFDDISGLVDLLRICGQEQMDAVTKVCSQLYLSANEHVLV